MIKASNRVNKHSLVGDCENTADALILLWMLSSTPWNIRELTLYIK